MQSFEGAARTINCEDKAIELEMMPMETTTV
jgi:hypothetical protein